MRAFRTMSLKKVALFSKGLIYWCLVGIEEETSKIWWNLEAKGRWTFTCAHGFVIWRML